MSLIECLRAQAALPTTFEKAVALVEDAGVLSCEVTPSEIRGVVRLAGRVRSSRGSAYRAYATLGLIDEEIIDYGCSCAAAENYDGLCKHALALALSYLGETPREGQPEERLRPVALAPTSLQLASVMESLAVASLDSGVARRSRGYDAPVELRVTLAAGAGPNDPWRLSAAVARGAVAVPVKDLAALARAWRNGAEVSYGRGLTFVHRPQAVTPASRGAFDLVARVVEGYEALGVSRYGFGGGTLGSLPLSQAATAELLDQLVGGVCTVVTDVGDERTVTVIEGDPVVWASLEASKQGGYDLFLPGNLLSCEAPGRLYLIDETTAWRCSEEFSARASGLLGGLLPARQPLHVAEGDVGTFCFTALPALRACTQLEVPPGLEAQMPPRAQFLFILGLEDGEVTCRAEVTYGEETIDLFAPVRPGLPVRDRVGELRAQETVEAFLPAVGGVHRFDESDDELLFALLTDGLRELGALGEVLLSERLRAVKVHPAPRLQVGARLYNGLLDLEVGTSGMTPRDLVEYLASYRRRQRFVRLSNGDIQRIGEEARALSELCEGLEVGVEELARGIHGLPLHRALYMEQLMRGVRGVLVNRNEELRRVVAAFEAPGLEGDTMIPARLASLLRPYQYKGVCWLGMLERLGCGGILADDMGLGKTLQAIAHIAACKEAGDGGPTLVVAPASLVYNWMGELARFAPELDTVAVVGPKGRRAGAIGKAADCDVLVTSYDLMKRDVELYVGQRFRRVILDEAQYIKNPTTQTAMAAKCIPAAVCFALTGTPVENRILELWSIFDFLMPGILGSRERFAERFEGAVENHEEGAAEGLRRLVAPFILRRLKTDVLEDLPEKSESVITVPLSGEQERLYKATQDRLALQITREQPRAFERAKLQVLAELTRLRQICCDPRLCFDGYRGGSAKLDACLELVHTAVDAGHRVLVFSQFTAMFELLGTRLRSAGLGYLTLTGQLSKEERARVVGRFQEDGAAEPVLLVSLKAGGVGLNLTAADVVIHYDPWWNFAAQNQATDRAYRLGQERAVSVYKLIAAGTVEERILQMQERKTALAQSVLEGEAVGSARLSREDVLAMLGAL